MVLSGWLRRNRKKLRLRIPHNHRRTTHPTQKMKAGLFAVVAVALLVTLVAGAQGASAPIPGFRPPAVPLVLMDPYMNVWLRGTNLTDAWATYVPLPLRSFLAPPPSLSFFPKRYNNFNENLLCRYWDGTVKALVGVRQESVFLF